MAVLNGGIFSRPRGKTGGIVFGAARTREGKLVTSRLLVSPSNPNTAAQQTQRGKFAEALAIVRLIGSGVYQSDWNRAIGQLPGFQSLLSVYLNAVNSSKQIDTIPPINLGSLHAPNTFSVNTGAIANQINLVWSTETGVNGTANDTLVALVVGDAPGSNPLDREVTVSTGALRSSGSQIVTMAGSGRDYNVLIYFKGAGTASGLISPTRNDEGTSR